MGSVKIDELARVTLSSLRVLFQKARENEEWIFKAGFTLQGIRYEVGYGTGWDHLLFMYTDRRGQRREVKVKLQTEQSNLGRGSVRYFLCPYTGHKCRTLYLDGLVVASRYAFPHVYSYQNHSQRERLLDNFFKNERPESDPHRKGGKWMYRGKLTRYGKRLLRYDEKVQREIKAMEEYLKPTFRGRPPKGGKREAVML